METLKLLSNINWIDNNVENNRTHSMERDTKEELEFEIDPEVIKFYEESLKFKRQRRKLKNKCNFY